MSAGDQLVRERWLGSVDVLGEPGAHPFDVDALR